MSDKKGNLVNQIEWQFRQHVAFSLPVRFHPQPLWSMLWHLPVSQQQQQVTILVFTPLLLCHYPSHQISNSSYSSPVPFASLKADSTSKHLPAGIGSSKLEGMTLKCFCIVSWLYLAWGPMQTIGSWRIPRMPRWPGQPGNSAIIITRGEPAF